MPIKTNPAANSEGVLPVASTIILSEWKVMGVMERVFSVEYRSKEI